MSNSSPARIGARAPSPTTDGGLLHAVFDDGHGRLLSLTLGIAHHALQCDDPRIARIGTGSECLAKTRACQFYLTSLEQCEA